MIGLPEFKAKGKGELLFLWTILTPPLHAKLRLSLSEYGVKRVLIRNPSNIFGRFGCKLGPVQSPYQDFIRLSAELEDVPDASTKYRNTLDLNLRLKLGNNQRKNFLFSLEIMRHEKSFPSVPAVKRNLATLLLSISQSQHIINK